MKPSSADLWLWEAVQARNVPTWAQALDAKRALSVFGTGPREARITQLIHGAINSRVSVRGPKLDQRNAMSSIQLVRKRPHIHAPANDPTLAGYLQWCIGQRGTGYDQRRPYYVRILRRLRP